MTVEVSQLSALADGCRACGSNALPLVLDLGAQYIQSTLVPPGSEPDQDPLPMELRMCDPNLGGCGLVQLAHTVNRSSLYTTYWYRSRVNDTMRAHLSHIAERTREVLGRSPNSILDIGCNDGTLLAQFPSNARRCGVEPSNARDDIDLDIEIVGGFFPSIELEGRSFEVITSIAMFYDIDEPVAFAQAVARNLADDGVWVLEVASLHSMVANCAYDAICHEHLTYYSVTTLSAVLEQANLRIVAVDFNDINGGSMCCFVKHGSAREASEASIARATHYESVSGLNRLTTLRHFAVDAVAHRQKLRSLLLEMVGTGQVVHVYGASTKGSTLLQFCGLSRDLLPYAAERNPSKVGLVMAGTGIAIVSEEESRAMAPDAYLVLPWHFRDEIIDREARVERSVEKPVSMVFPLPRVERIDLDGREMRYSQ